MMRYAAMAKNYLFICLLLISTADHAQQQRLNILLLMSDNQYVTHLGAYGDSTVRTPNIDAVAREGLRFTHAFCAAPSCTPSRAAMLTGQDTWRLGEGANLWGTLPATCDTYVDLLERSGYAVGFSGKGWGPGNYQAAGRNRNPAGNPYNNFDAFLKTLKTSQPWTFWFSSREPHRPYPPGSGEAGHIQTASIKVPPYLPDTDSVRHDIADYYAAIETFDRQVGEIVEQLKKSDQYANTVIIICSDNGWQMPRGLGNLYDAGSHIPLIISFAGWQKGRVYDDFVNLNDLAPTILSLAAVRIPATFTARSLLPLLLSQQLAGIVEVQRDAVFMGRERHAFVRTNGIGYPARAIRTNNYLYIRNYEPGRWPAGDPPLYGDVDAHMLHYPSPTKVEVMNSRPGADSNYFVLAFAKRPAEELYDLRSDPYQLKNVAGDARYGEEKQLLRNRLDNYLMETGDPRATNKPVNWDTMPYYNERDKSPKPSVEYRKMLGLDSIYHYDKIH